MPLYIIPIITIYIIHIQQSMIILQFFMRQISPDRRIMNHSDLRIYPMCYLPFLTNILRKQSGDQFVTWRNWELENMSLGKSLSDTVAYSLFIPDEPTMQKIITWSGTGLGYQLSPFSTRETNYTD